MIMFSYTEEIVHNRLLSHNLTFVCIHSYIKSIPIVVLWCKNLLSCSKPFILHYSQLKLHNILYSQTLPGCSPCTWTVALPCTKTCGGKGMQVLVRECNGEKPCEGPSHKVEPCGYCPCKLLLELHITQCVSVIVIIIFMFDYSDYSVIAIVSIIDERV